MWNMDKSKIQVLNYIFTSVTILERKGLDYLQHKLFGKLMYGFSTHNIWDDPPPQA